ncbi:MAG: hypothetical protein R3Y35_04835 [Clostridia bacterium]
MKTPYLSTSFSENGKKAKNRFANILNTNEKKLGIVFIIIVIILLVIFSTIFSTSSTEISNELLYSQMGLEKEDIFENINLNENDMNIESTDIYSNYVFEHKIDGQNCSVSLIFYEDFLMGYQLIFENDYSNEYFESMKTEFSEKLGTNYIYTQMNEGLINNYDWSIENGDFLSKMSSDDTTSLLLSLSSTSFESSEQTVIVVRYSLNQN